MCEGLLCSRCLPHQEHLNYRFTFMFDIGDKKPGKMRCAIQQTIVKYFERFDNGYLCSEK